MGVVGVRKSQSRQSRVDCTDNDTSADVGRRAALKPWLS